MVIGGLEKMILEYRHKVHKVNKVLKAILDQLGRLVILVQPAHREKLVKPVRRDLLGRKVYKDQLVHLALE
jgi:hypothetical protein